jgi:periplasmic divalent cation tolerance protein
MNLPVEFCVVFVTTPSEEVAEKIAKTLVEEGVAACVNILTQVRSIYRWKGRVEDEREALMVIKTRFSLFDNLKGIVRSMHPYSVPEVIALPIQGGTEEYLRWMEEVTSASGLKDTLSGSSTPFSSP